MPSGLTLQIVLKKWTLFKNNNNKKNTFFLFLCQF